MQSQLRFLTIVTLGLCLSLFGTHAQENASAPRDMTILKEVMDRAANLLCNPRYCRVDSDCTTGSACGTCWASLCGPAPSAVPDVAAQPQASPPVPASEAGSTSQDGFGEVASSAGRIDSGLNADTLPIPPTSTAGAAAAEICGRSYVYWVATYGHYQNGHPALIYGSNRPARNQEEIRDQAASCLRIDRNTVQQVINYGRNKGIFGEHCGQLLHYC